MFTVPVALRLIFLKFWITSHCYYVIVVWSKVYLNELAYCMQLWLVQTVN